MKTIEVFNGEIHKTRMDVYNAELVQKLNDIGLEKQFKHPQKGAQMTRGQCLKMAIEDMNNRYERALSLNKEINRLFDAEYDCILKELITPLAEQRDTIIKQATIEYDTAIKPFVDTISKIKNEYRLEKDETNRRLEGERIKRIADFKKGFKEADRDLR